MKFLAILLFVAAIVFSQRIKGVTAWEYIDRIIFLLLCIFFIFGLALAIKQILAIESKPSTIIGFFNLLSFIIIIIVFSIFDIDKFHIIWLFVLVYILSGRKFAFQIGIVLFNIACRLLKKPNILNDKDNVFR